MGNHGPSGNRGQGTLRRVLEGIGELVGFYRKTKRRDYDLIAASGLFDPAYYRDLNADLARHRDPLKHYLERGWVGGRDPSPQFHTSWYLDRYADVRNARINPLVHYLKWGRSEGRLPKRPSPTTETYETLGPYESWLAVNALSERDVQELRQRLQLRSAQLPAISVVAPVYNTKPRLLEEMVSSVANQIYGDWELVLIDDGSDEQLVAPLLERFADADNRIRVKRLPINGGISAATNIGVEMSTGDVVVFLDHDDLLSRDCLAEIALYYAEHPEADLVYSDDDKIDSDGIRYTPQFKPDWAPTLLLSWMYLSHALSVRREIFQCVGGFRSEFDGSQDYDFTLRAAEVARHVGHIPKVLYHWRAVPGSTATGGQAKPDSLQRGLRAVQQALERRGIDNARAFHPEWAAEANAGIFDIDFADEAASVTIVIQAADEVSFLRKCLDSLGKTTYRNYDILILDNGITEAGVRKYLKAVEAAGAAKVERLVPGFNLARAFNEAVRRCSSDYVLFLDGRAEVINENWLTQMVGYAKLQGVGAVGARIHSKDGTLAHAGIVFGYNEGLAGPAFRGLSPDDPGYLAFVRTSREYSGVGGGCLLTSRALFHELGGFDESCFPGFCYDVDYCSRAVNAGRSCIYCASAQFRLLEAKDDDLAVDPTEAANFRRLYGSEVDPWYNPNLSLERFEIDAVRPETLSEDPIRLVAVSHNLNNEGAPTTLCDLLIGLAERRLADPLVLSPADGPLREEYEKHGIQVIVLKQLMRGVFDRETQSVAFDGAGMLFKALGAQVILANTLQTYWAVKGAKMAGLPSILAQHESEPWDTYYEYLPADLRASGYEAFADAYRVVFVARATLRAWQAVEKRRNFKVIRHAIPRLTLAENTARWNRSSARRELGVPADAYVVSVVGTVCRRKGQLDLVRAYQKLPDDVQPMTYAYIAGELAEQDYADEIKAATRDNASNVVLTGHVEDPFLYYAASDICVCTSRVESAPRVLVEAMACGLPIITTPVFGISELVRENFNAIYYQPGDPAGLSNSIRELLTNDVLRRTLADNSPKVLNAHPDFDDMVDQYGHVIRQAANLKVDAQKA